MVYRVDLAKTPVRDRVEYLDSLTRDCAVPFRSRSAEPDMPLTFVHMHREFGSLTAFENMFSNYSGTRPPGVARSSDEKVLTVGMPLGPMGFASGDSRVRGNSRSMVPFWGLTPYGAEVRREICYRALVVPIDELRLPHLLVRNLTGIDLGASPMATVLAGHVGMLLSLPELTAQEESALERPTIELLRAVLVTAAGDDSAGQEPLNRTLGMRTLAFLEASYTDPTVSMASLAAHLGVSRTTAYGTLRRLELNFSDWLRERRLNRAVELLGLPTPDLMSIGELARAIGFRDHATFTRAFRSRHGCSPTEWRRAHAEGEPAA